ncbi:acetylornithine transaminase [Micromonospora echinofusca]|uniref:Acetylornithine transaminase n=1 Tax=Micromonospora echinofusca TaxID=47858 RepID=A0ABS3VP38_MICEH|nr:acetylornithine transaminase [Micromonospora echinofusca]MBO4206262.1 acetylornithine transaminase [Micromonospora echinofusca]
MSASDELRRRFAAALMPNYGVPAVAVARGSGCRVWDLDGHDYLDLIGGIAVSTLGHAHPELVAAVADQVATLTHISNLHLHEPGVRLAERILGLLGTDGRVFFANSGAEANEAALKLVRRHAGPDRTYLVAAVESFHGRTRGALSVTGRAAIRDPFGPLGTEVRFVPYGSTPALTEAVTPQCVGVILEPFQGEAGVVEPPEGYLAAARAVCDDTGTALIFDEVQSGIGRTGAWFYHQSAGVRPDVVTLAKGLGGGLPIGACVGLGSFGTAFRPGDHGSTFGGNPVACAAALTVLDVIARDGLLTQVTEVGDELRTGINRIAHPLLAGARGRGLWVAVTLTAPRAAAVESAARTAGFLVHALRPDTLRLAPPLILSRDEARSFTDALPKILAEA